MSGGSPHILIVEARYYAHVADLLLEGCRKALDEVGATHETITVPGALEIPTAIALADSSDQFDGFVALGCVIRGETSHYDLVAGESARGLIDLGVQTGCAIGNGILTVENEAQALVRADPEKKNKGRDAALAALALVALAERFVANG
ncbi:MAG: 6,7-dimethyl-8-ribityllumazine synthase [Geminicoccaceae bacterium]